MELILASQSPRRRELLTEHGYAFRVVPPDESAEGPRMAHETPADYVQRLAKQKAANVAPRIDEGLIIACDTVAECDGTILGKPENRAHAATMLHTMKGKQHRVFSGLCLWHRPSNVSNVGVAATELRMDALSDAQIEDYLASGLWSGKAGAFGYQDGLDWVHIVQGTASNVVGLPMELLRTLIKSVQAKVPS